MWWNGPRSTFIHPKSHEDTQHEKALLYFLYLVWKINRNSYENLLKGESISSLRSLFHQLTIITPLTEKCDRVWQSWVISPSVWSFLVFSWHFVSCLSLFGGLKCVQLLKSCCPAAFSCIPTPTQLNEMVGLPRQHAVKLGKGLLTSLH